MLPGSQSMQQQWPVIQNHAISMRNVLNVAVSMDLKYVVAVYCIMVIDPDSIDPSILSLPKMMHFENRNQQQLTKSIYRTNRFDWHTCFVFKSSSFLRYVSCGSVCWRNKYSATCLDGNSVSHTYPKSRAKWMASPNKTKQIKT